MDAAIKGFVNAKEKNDFLLGLFSGFDEYDFATGFSHNKFKKQKLDGITPTGKRTFLLEQKIKLKTNRFQTDTISFEIKIRSKRERNGNAVNFYSSVQIDFPKDIVFRDGTIRRVYISAFCPKTQIDYESGTLIGEDIAKRFRFFKEEFGYEILDALHSWESKKKHPEFIVKLQFPLRNPQYSKSKLEITFYDEKYYTFHYWAGEKNILLAGAEKDIKILITNKNLEKITSGRFNI